FYCRTKWCVTRLVLSTIALTSKVRGDGIHPSHYLAIGKIDLDDVMRVPGTIARAAAATKGRAQILPAGGTSRVTLRIIGIAPHKTERVGTHPYAGGTALHSRTI